MGMKECNMGLRLGILFIDGRIMGEMMNISLKISC